MVVDNGSTKELAKSTTHKLPENIFFGGGLNVIMNYFLSTNQDYLILFNNDLIFHGPRLIENMLSEIKESNLDLYSPSITNSGKGQSAFGSYLTGYDTAKDALVVGVKYSF
jgi:GT2 family glycosyltransferase